MSETLSGIFLSGATSNRAVSHSHALFVYAQRIILAPGLLVDRTGIIIEIVSPLMNNDGVFIASAGIVQSESSLTVSPDVVAM